jgi:hypothetical protein
MASKLDRKKQAGPMIVNTPSPKNPVRIMLPQKVAKMENAP